MALLDLQGMEATKGGHGPDHSGLSLLVCGGSDSSLSLLAC
jgi:hypothetical protein